MANDFYTHTTFPAFRSSGSSSTMRAELDLIDAGFAKIAPLTGNGNKFVKVNSGATAQEASSTLYESGSNIGIGTNAPATKLSIVSSAATLLRLRGGTGAAQGSAFSIFAAGSASTLFAVGDSSAILGDSPDASCTVFTAGGVPLRMVVGSTEKARFHPTGEFVVGHNGSPAALLDVGTSVTTATTIGVRIGYSSNHYGFRLANESNAGSVAAGKFKIQRGDTTTWLDCVTVDNSGNVGIGTAAPVALVDVATQVSTATTLGIRIGYSSNFCGFRLANESNAGVVAAGKFKIQRGDTTAWLDCVTVDNSGNVGIGTAAPVALVDVATQVTTATTIGIRIGYSSNFCGFRLANESNAGVVAAGKFKIQRGDTTTWLDCVTVDNSGNVGIGTATPSSKFVVYDSSVSVAVSEAPTQALWRASAGSATADLNATTTYGEVRTATNHPLLFSTNGIERARVDTDGSLVAGTTTKPFGTTRFVAAQATGHAVEARVGSLGYYSIICANETTSGDASFVYFGTEANGATNRGSITYNRAGGLTAYNTTSDYRAKDVFGLVADAGDVIDQFRVYAGRMKGASLDRPMLVAHEVQAVAPYAVTGEKDAVDGAGRPVYQQLDQGPLVPLLISEIQSLRRRVGALERS